MADDCDDSDSDVHPGAAEIEGNALDEDCDGTAQGAPDALGGAPGIACSTAGRGAGVWFLLCELQWEKAARGVDGRVYPWGDGFDPTLCRTHGSTPGRPQPAVVGAYTTDTSPYGVRDLAGSMRDWCGDADYGGNSKHRPVRGGSWFARAHYCRAANRNGLDPWAVSSSNGFRFARSPIRSGPQDAD